MKKLKLALLVAAPLLLAACASSIPNEPTSAGGPVNPYGKGGGRNNFDFITIEDERGN